LDFPNDFSNFPPTLFIKYLTILNFEAAYTPTVADIVAELTAHENKIIKPAITHFIDIPNYSVIDGQTTTTLLTVPLKGNEISTSFEIISYSSTIMESNGFEKYA
jgi:hypothetical protein